MHVYLGGVASLSIGDQFTVGAMQVASQRPGLLVGSLAPASIPFFGGLLCLAPPITRTGLQFSGGNPTPDCSGSYSFYFSQTYLAQQGITAGTTVHAQYWQRDPDHPDGTGVGLTDAVAFVVVP